MSKGIVYYEYLQVEGAELFTLVCLPQKEGKFPTIIYRTPYADSAEEQTEQEVCQKKLELFQPWIERGYAYIFQHCRGRGKSSGDCIPYIFEREDGLMLQDWIRKQPFYNGELYLLGASYTSSVHFVTTPFAPDIKGAIFSVQDCERYNCNYRNGFYKTGLHGRWYVGMYKKKSILQKNFNEDSFHLLPICDFSKTVFGERSADFDAILEHPQREDPFWQTRFGGGEARDAIKHANIPILLTTGFYDIYTGGVFDMWMGLDEQTRAKSALVVQPYGHNGLAEGQPIPFEKGQLNEAFPDWELRWIDSIRGKGDAPFEKGKVTYYHLFGEGWRTDEFEDGKKRLCLPFGEGEKTYRYDPRNPATFQGGLSANFGGNAWQDPPNSRPDIISVFTDAFQEDTPIKGKMRARLKVRSDCEDTCFYLRISLDKPEGAYGLRDDINQISNFCADYRPGQELLIEFSFDEHAFLIGKGERLRIDISSSADPYYLRHTNQKGPFSKQTQTRIAENTVVLNESFLELPIE